MVITNQGIISHNCNFKINARKKLKENKTPHCALSKLKSEHKSMLQFYLHVQT